MAADKVAKAEEARAVRVAAGRVEVTNLALAQRATVSAQAAGTKNLTWPGSAVLTKPAPSVARG